MWTNAQPQSWRSKAATKMISDGFAARCEAMALPRRKVRR